MKTRRFSSDSSISSNDDDTFIDFDGQLSKYLTEKDLHQMRRTFWESMYYITNFIGRVKRYVQFPNEERRQLIIQNINHLEKYLYMKRSFFFLQDLISLDEDLRLDDRVSDLIFHIRKVSPKKNQSDASCSTSEKQQHKRKFKENSAVNSCKRRKCVSLPEEIIEFELDEDNSVNEQFDNVKDKSIRNKRKTVTPIKKTPQKAMTTKLFLRNKTPEEKNTPAKKIPEKTNKLNKTEDNDAKSDNSKVKSIGNKKKNIVTPKKTPQKSKTLKTKSELTPKSKTPQKINSSQKKQLLNSIKKATPCRRTLRLRNSPENKIATSPSKGCRKVFIDLNVSKVFGPPKSLSCEKPKKIIKKKSPKKSRLSLPAKLDTKSVTKKSGKRFLFNEEQFLKQITDSNIVF